MDDIDMGSYWACDNVTIQYYNLYGLHDFGRGL